MAGDVAGCLQLEVACSTNCWQRGRLLKALSRDSKGDWWISESLASKA